MQPSVPTSCVKSPASTSSDPVTAPASPKPRSGRCRLDFFRFFGAGGLDQVAEHVIRVRADPQGAAGPIGGEPAAGGPRAGADHLPDAGPERAVARPRLAAA